MAMHALISVVLVLSFGVLGLSGCASVDSGKSVHQKALTPSEEADRLFEILDVDGNGKISREEARSGFKYMIASYDRDGSNEVLAAKPGGTPETAGKKKSKRRPTSEDANKAFEALFEKSNATSNEISKDEFKKMVVKASDNPETDPFVVFR